MDAATVFIVAELSPSMPEFSGRQKTRWADKLPVTGTLEEKSETNWDGEKPALLNSWLPPATNKRHSKSAIDLSEACGFWIRLE